MPIYKQLFASMGLGMSLLGANAWALDDTAISCEFSPYLQCSANGTSLWSNTRLNDPTLIVMDHTHIYLSQNKTALSLDASSGDPIWDAHTQNDARYFHPVLDNQHVYLARTDGILEKRQGETGGLIWSKGVGSGWIYPPITTENTLITAGQDRILWILDAKSGAIQDQISLTQELVAPLFRVGNQFIASTFDGLVTAYSIDSHAPDWQAQISNPVFAHYQYADKLITADMDGTLSAIDAQTGELRWQYKVHKNAQFWNVLHQQTLVSLTDSGTLNILDANNGQLLSSFSFASQFAQAPIVQDDSIALFDTEGSTLHVSIDESSMSQINLNKFN